MLRVNGSKNILTENLGGTKWYIFVVVPTADPTKKILGPEPGQSANLGGVKGGRLARYFWLSYLKSKIVSVSLIRKALLKYGHENFSLFILEYCPVNLLDEREQAWGAKFT